MEGTIGEVRLFAGNFAPRNWAFCQGQILSISQNTALFSILGTTYGGNGQTTFALPDLQGRAPIGTGQGPGLSSRTLGERAGTENVTLIQTQMPAHNHAAQATVEVQVPVNGAVGDQASPVGNHLAASPTSGRDIQAPVFTANAGSQEFLAGPQGSAQVTVGVAGGSQPHENMQPYLAINYIICLYGVYPSRS